MLRYCVAPRRGGKTMHLVRMVINNNYEGIDTLFIAFSATEAERVECLLRPWGLASKVYRLGHARPAVESHPPPVAVLLDNYDVMNQSSADEIIHIALSRDIEVVASITGDGVLTPPTQPATFHKGGIV